MLHVLVLAVAAMLVGEGVGGGGGGLQWLVQRCSYRILGQQKIMVIMLVKLAFVYHIYKKLSPYTDRLEHLSWSDVTAFLPVWKMPVILILAIVSNVVSDVGTYCANGHTVLMQHVRFCMDDSFVAWYCVTCRSFKFIVTQHEYTVS